MANPLNKAGVLDLEVPEGALWSETLNLEDENGDPVPFVTPVTALCEVRSDFDKDTSTVLVTITVDDTNAATGEFGLSLAAADTLGTDVQNILEAATATTERVQVGYWDLRIIESGETDGVYAVEGSFTINRRISRT